MGSDFGVDAQEQRDEEFFAYDQARVEGEEDDMEDGEEPPTYMDEDLEPWRYGLSAEEMLDLGWELEVMDSCTSPRSLIPLLD